MTGKVLAVLLASVCALQAQGKPGVAAKREAVAGVLMTQDEKLALAKRALLDEEPFLSSFQAQYGQTLNIFFGAPEYQVLRGNPLVGYTANNGFRWPKGLKEVAFVGITNAPRASALTPQAWATAFRAAAKGHGLTVNTKAAVRFEGACVSLTEDPQQDLIGLVLEAKVTGPTGEFLYRFQFARPRLGDAMTGTFDWILGYAQAIGDTEGAQALAQRLKAKAAAAGKAQRKEG